MILFRHETVDAADHPGGVRGSRSERDIGEWPLFMGGGRGCRRPARPDKHREQVQSDLRLLGVITPSRYNAQKQQQHGILFTAAYSFSKAIDDTPRLRLGRRPWPAARQDLDWRAGSRVLHTGTRIAFGARHFPEPSFAWVQPSWFLLARLRSAHYRLLPIAAARQRGRN